jgi:hypothetical protein
MDCSDLRPYRRHQIVARKGGLFGRPRYQVWHGGSLVGTFRDVVSAERHVDARMTVRGGQGR